MEKKFKDIWSKVVEAVKLIPEKLKCLPEWFKGLPDKFEILLNKIKRFFERLKAHIAQKNEAKQSKKRAKAETREGKIPWDKIWYVCREVFQWIYRLRSLLLALPVMVASIVLAVYSNARLPEYVGLNMQATGEYATVISRSVAVMGPLALTVMCLLLMFCSKKVLYPWLISVFSLALPLLFLFTSTFP